MKITLLCGDINHPVMPYLESWASKWSDSAIEIKIYTKKEDLTGGDILFLISFPQLVGHEIRTLYKKCLVMHASDLPHGKGWSPQIWQVLEGKKEIVVSLFEAVEKVDAGDIWKKLSFSLGGHETFDEINHEFYKTEMQLMDWAIENFNIVVPYAQSTTGESFYPRRRPRDSQLDISRPLIEQFNLLRVCDPDRYPAYFEHLGHRYELVLKKTKNTPQD